MNTVYQPPGIPPLPTPHWAVIDAWQAGFATASQPLAFVLRMLPVMTEPSA